MIVSKKTARDIDLVKKWEGLRLEPYRDSAGLWTVGYGHLLPQGNTLKPITKQQADILLDHDIETARRAVSDLVTVPLTHNQRAALVSFVFNVGRGNFANSTLLRKLNAGDYDGAAREFGRWVYAGGRKVAGLENRRFDEMQTFIA